MVRRRQTWAQRHQLVDYSRPNKRWCIVRQCPDCRRMAHNETAYLSLAFQSNGTLIGEPPRVFPFFRFSDQCSDCEWRAKKFTPIVQCDCCGRFRWEGTTGVEMRYDCRKRDFWPWPKLCVSCWNRIRGVRKAMRELDSLTRQIERAAKARRIEANAGR